MATKQKTGRSRTPQHIDAQTWYYEERRGIYVLRMVAGEDGYRCTETFTIPWKILRESIKRDDESRAKRK